MGWATLTNLETGNIEFLGDKAGKQQYQQYEGNPHISKTGRFVGPQELVLIDSYGE